jgi:cytochrome c oxidase assembly protein subunit 11
MSSTPVSERTLPPARRGNRTVVLICVGVLVAMVAAAYAAVPLYRAFCQATGFAGTTRRATKAPGQVLAQKLIVGFDTNVRGLPWTFKAVQTSQTLQIGDTGLAFFTVTNNADHPLTGRAAYNVAPDQAGAYFRKLQCFCFNDQTIPAHTTMKFPVVYFVDPKFASDPDTKNFSTVTLSYTFFPVAPAPTKTPQGLGGAAGGRL